MSFARHILASFVVFLSLVVVTSASALTASESSLLAAMNRARAAHGLAALHVDPALERAARSHSLDMLGHGYFAHGDFGARMTSFGARGPALAENLAWGSGPLGSAASIVRMWLRSPGHRQNLLHPGYTRVGVASPVGSFQGHAVAMVTADFAGS
jgi:uncharacterized protein YkwD